MHLTAVEGEVVAAYLTGSPLDLTGDQPPRPIRGEVVSRLLVDDPEVVASVGPRSRLHLTGAVVEGPVDLVGATIGRPVDLRGCSFDAPVLLTDAEVKTLRLPACALPALEATNLRVQGDLVLDDGFTTTGRVVLLGARIDGALRMSRAWLATDLSLVESDDAALMASRMRVDGSMFLARIHVHGQVRLISARVGGALSLKDSVIDRPGGTAVHAERLHVAEGAMLERASWTGRLYLQHARIGGSLDATDATFGRDDRSDSSVALTYCQVGANATFTRARVGGRLLAARATIDGTLNLGEASFVPGSEILLTRATASAADLRAADPPRVIGLRHARIDAIDDREASWPKELDLDGFVYQSLHATYAPDATPKRPVDDRLRWLSRGGSAFLPQPYDQLMASLRANGNEQDARTVGLARERARRATLGWPGRLVGLLQDATVGYGYRTWRVLPWLAGLTAAVALVFSVHRPAPKTGAPTFNAVAFAFDLLLPVIDLGQASTHNPTGWTRSVGWVVVVVGWALTSALVAGLGRTLVRD